MMSVWVFDTEIVIPMRQVHVVLEAGHKKSRTKGWISKRITGRKAREVVSTTWISWSCG